MELKDYRRQYTKGGLARAALPKNPLDLFTQWQSDAAQAGLADPTGCVVATVQPDGSVRQRFVLLKGFDEQGFVFFTNYQSDKAVALARYGRASMLFPWNELDRQVSISGEVTKISEEASDAYFSTRPYASQIAAWTSDQSRPIASRSDLEAQYQRAVERFEDHDVARPPHWGGFRLTPQRIEFWQGGSDRLHDRFVYDFDVAWILTRLQP
ncbi:pyridoxamine 5'-phosphate oxidase [Luminiphilus sp.]|nr:pyridoxamine 5'-phosphate oxidase [Luminiphilus sp.]MDB2690977.1 pyridoxamine 5'-phosphate oxidase [Luminiphilus sp.]